ncbi:MAG: dihydrofolate reductase family protein [Muribaculaceae bacterium]|nr:dihydrofolate reductase family protein [Muribaculaceae bacterium]
MSRPYIVVHMMTTLDGRIDCPVVAQISGHEYYEALDKIGKTSKVSGKVTAVLENTALRAEITEHTGIPVGEESVNIAQEADEYSIVADTLGSLRWKKNEEDGHPLLCIVSQQATLDYLEELREQGISWIATGKNRIDLARAAELLKEHFGIGKLSIVGGGHICGGFLAAGIVDEVSVMIAPGIDGRKGQTAVFDGIVKPDDTPYRLKLKSVEQWPGTEVIWLRYSVEK